MEESSLKENCRWCNMRLVPGFHPTTVILSLGRLEVICTSCFTCNAFIEIFPKLPYPRSSPGKDDNGLNDDKTKVVPVSPNASNDDKTKVVPVSPNASNNDKTKVVPVSPNASNDAKTKVVPVSPNASNDAKTKVVPASPNASRNPTRSSRRGQQSSIYDYFEPKTKSQSKEAASSSNNLQSQAKELSRSCNPTPKQEDEKKSISAADKGVTEGSVTTIPKNESENSLQSSSTAKRKLPCENLVNYRHKKVKKEEGPKCLSENIIHSLCRPPNHTSLPISAIQSSNACRTCHMTENDISSTKRSLIYCPCCKSVPSFCSQEHFDAWHSVTHNWMVIPPTQGNSKPQKLCKVCPEQNYTRFYCPACPWNQGYCSLGHYEDVHNKMSFSDQEQPPLEPKKDDDGEKRDKNRFRSNSKDSSSENSSKNSEASRELSNKSSQGNEIIPKERTNFSNGAAAVIPNFAEGHNSIANRVYSINNKSGGSVLLKNVRIQSKYSGVKGYNRSCQTGSSKCGDLSNKSDSSKDDNESLENSNLCNKDKSIGEEDLSKRSNLNKGSNDSLNILKGNVNSGTCLDIQKSNTDDPSKLSKNTDKKKLNSESMNISDSSSRENIVLRDSTLVTDSLTLKSLFTEKDNEVDLTFSGFPAKLESPIPQTPTGGDSSRIPDASEQKMSVNIQSSNPERNNLANSKNVGSWASDMPNEGGSVSSEILRNEIKELYQEKKAKFTEKDNDQRSDNFELISKSNRNYDLENLNNDSDINNKSTLSCVETDESNSVLIEVNKGAINSESSNKSNLDTESAVSNDTCSTMNKENIATDELSRTSAAPEQTYNNSSNNNSSNNNNNAELLNEKHVISTRTENINKNCHDFSSKQKDSDKLFVQDHNGS